MLCVLLMVMVIVKMNYMDGSKQNSPIVVIMLTLEVGERKFQLPQDVIDHSQTLTDLLNYTNHDNIGDQTIVLNVEPKLWSNYMTITKFLLSNPQIPKNPRKLDFGSSMITKITNSLSMMDYLNNVKQLQRWFVVFYACYDMTLADVKQLISHTSFTMTDLDPFFATTNISQIMPLITDVHAHPYSSHIDHIIHILYDNDVYNKYKILSSHTELSQLYSDNENTHIQDGKFLIVSKHVNKLDVSIHIFANLNNNTPPGMHSYITQPEIISPRIAVYYTDKHIYSVNSGNKQTLVVTDTISPYLCKLVVKHKTYYACSHVNQDAMESISNDKLPITTDYVPYIGHKFPINTTFGDMYNLYTYNVPSTKNRDYYILLIYECDPIEKILYAFCL